MFNIDTAYVNVKYANGSMTAVDCTLAGNKMARNMYKSIELEGAGIQCARNLCNLQFMYFVNTLFARLSGLNRRFPQLHGCSLVS